jgi:hypothetical protein
MWAVIATGFVYRTSLIRVPWKVMSVSVPSVDDSFGLKLLPIVLSIVAGSADVVSFLGLRALFVAHITGNLIIIAAHLVTGTRVTSTRCSQSPFSYSRSFRRGWR